MYFLQAFSPPSLRAWIDALLFSLFRISQNPIETYLIQNNFFFSPEHCENNLETSLIGKALDFGSNEYGFESRVSNVPNKLYVTFMSQYNIAIRKKKQFFVVKNTSTNYQLGRVFARLGLVRLSLSSDRQTLSATLFYTRNQKLTKIILLNSATKSSLPISNKALRLLVTNVPTQQLILSTPYGVLTSHEAVALGVGGQAILKIM